MSSTFALHHANLHSNLYMWAFVTIDSAILCAKLHKMGIMALSIPLPQNISTLKAKISEKLCAMIGAKDFFSFAPMRVVFIMMC